MVVGFSVFDFEKIKVNGNVKYKNTEVNAKNETIKLICSAGSDVITIQGTTDNEGNYDFEVPLRIENKHYEDEITGQFIPDTIYTAKLTVGNDYVNLYNGQMFEIHEGTLELTCNPEETTDAFELTATLSPMDIPGVTVSLSHIYPVTLTYYEYIEGGENRKVLEETVELGNDGYNHATIQKNISNTPELIGLDTIIVQASISFLKSLEIPIKVITPTEKVELQVFGNREGENATMIFPDDIFAEPPVECLVDWGDGSELESYDNESELTHDYTIVDEETEEVEPDFYNIYPVTMYITGNNIMFNGSNSPFAYNPDNPDQCFILKAALSDGINIDESTNLFESQENLQSVRLPSNTTVIGSNCFSFCKSLKDIVLPDSVTKLGAHAFQYANMNSLKLPSGLKEIGIGCFVELTIPYLNIPRSVTTIKNQPFGNNTNHINCKEIKFNWMDYEEIIDYVSYGGIYEDYCNDGGQIIVPDGEDSQGITPIRQHYDGKNYPCLATDYTFLLEFMNNAGPINELSLLKNEEGILRVYRVRENATGGYDPVTYDNGSYTFGYYDSNDEFQPLCIITLTRGQGEHIIKAGNRGDILIRAEESPWYISYVNDLVIHDCWNHIAPNHDINFEHWHGHESLMNTDFTVTDENNLITIHKSENESGSGSSVAPYNTGLLLGMEPVYACDFKVKALIKFNSETEINQSGKKYLAVRNEWEGVTNEGHQMLPSKEADAIYVGTLGKLGCSTGYISSFDSHMDSTNNIQLNKDRWYELNIQYSRNYISENSGSVSVSITDAESGILIKSDTSIGIPWDRIPSDLSVMLTKEIQDYMIKGIWVYNNKLNVYPTVSRATFDIDTDRSLFVGEHFNVEIESDKYYDLQDHRAGYPLPKEIPNRSGTIVQSIYHPAETGKDGEGNTIIITPAYYEDITIGQFTTNDQGQGIASGRLTNAQEKLFLKVKFDEMKVGTDATLANNIYYAQNYIPYRISQEVIPNPAPQIADQYIVDNDYWIFQFNVDGSKLKDTTPVLYRAFDDKEITCNSTVINEDDVLCSMEFQSLADITGGDDYYIIFEDTNGKSHGFTPTFKIFKGVTITSNDNGHPIV